METEKATENGNSRYQNIHQQDKNISRQTQKRQKPNTRKTNSTWATMWNTTEMVQPENTTRSTATPEISRSIQHAANMEIHRQCENFTETTKLQTSHQKHDNALAQNKAELISRWTEWIRQQFQTQKQQPKPKITHVTEQ